MERTILSNLIHNEKYLRKVSPFLIDKYFTDPSEKIVLDETLKFFGKYNKTVTPEILKIEISNRTDISEGEYKAALECVNNLSTKPDDYDWLITSTEKFCQKKALFNSIVQSIAVIEGRDKTVSEHAIPELLQTALNVSFDSHVGHDYIEDAEERYEYYHKTEERIPFDIDILNKITKGGVAKKTLNAVIAASGSGKSAFLCHLAAATMRQGLDVLYITMEMAEERISERIDANLMKVNINDIENFDKEHFLDKIEKIKSKSCGKLIVKEFPTSSAHVGHFRALLEELKVKKGFVPKLIVVDYLNICCSSRIRMGGSINSYTYIKFIAEELRGLAVEYDVPIWSATQTTRDGLSSTDIEMSDTSESVGLIYTLDLYLAMMSPEELMELNQTLFKQLKNRYNDPNFYKKFVVGFDRAKMTFYNLEASAQADLSSVGSTDNKSGKKSADKPAFDNSKFGSRMRERADFGDFKFGDDA